MNNHYHIFHYHWLGLFLFVLVLTPTVLVHAAPTFSPLTTPMAVGQTGAHITQLQQMLQVAGDYSATPTGLYDQPTITAVQQFQTRYNLLTSGSPDTNGYGLAGPATRAKLNQLYVSTTTAPPVTTPSSATAPSSETEAKLRSQLVSLLKQLIVLLTNQLNILLVQRGLPPVTNSLVGPVSTIGSTSGGNFLASAAARATTTTTTTSGGGSSGGGGGGGSSSSGGNTTVTITPATHLITATVGAGGAITPTGQVAVTDATNQVFTLTPNVGYSLATLTIDGQTVAASSTYTFANLTTDHQINATFEVIPPVPATPTVTLTTQAAPANTGTITRSLTQTTYPQDSQLTLTATPQTGYRFTGWSGDATGSANPLTLALGTNKAITANFQIISYTITASAGSGGSVTPTGVATVNYGANQSFTLTPNANYQISQVLIDGTSVAIATTYAFQNVTANHTLAVTFSPITITPPPPVACSENWSCTSWSTCVGSNQTRTCTDLNNCAVN